MSVEGNVVTEIQDAYSVIEQRYREYAGYTTKFNKSAWEAAKKDYEDGWYQLWQEDKTQKWAKRISDYAARVTYMG